jgi:hypothetical protein
MLLAMSVKSNLWQLVTCDNAGQNSMAGAVIGPA